MHLPQILPLPGILPFFGGQKRQEMANFRWLYLLIFFSIIFLGDFAG
jgi:hypothetical protein